MFCDHQSHLYPCWLIRHKLTLFVALNKLEFKWPTARNNRKKNIDQFNSTASNWHDIRTKWKWTNKKRDSLPRWTKQFYLWKLWGMQKKKKKLVHHHNRTSVYVHLYGVNLWDNISSIKQKTTSDNPPQNTAI